MLALVLEDVICNTEQRFDNHFDADFFERLAARASF
jgi:hypothetical protein